MTVIEIGSMHSTKQVEVGEGPFAVALDVARDRLFVANVRSGDVTVIDTATESVVGKIPVGGAPYGLAVDPESNRVLATNQHGDRVSIIDATNLRVRGTVAVGRYPEAVAVSNGKAYVANWFSGDLSILDPAGGRQAAAAVKLCEGPRSMAFAGVGDAHE